MYVNIYRCDLFVVLTQVSSIHAWEAVCLSWLVVSSWTSPRLVRDSGNIEGGGGRTRRKFGDFSAHCAKCCGKDRHKKKRSVALLLGHVWAYANVPIINVECVWCRSIAKSRIRGWIIWSTTIQIKQFAVITNKIDRQWIKIIVIAVWWRTNLTTGQLLAAFYSCRLDRCWIVDQLMKHHRKQGQEIFKGV